MKNIRRIIALILAVMLLFLTSCASDIKDEKIDNAISQTAESGEYLGDNLKYYINTPVNNGEPITITAYINEDWAGSYNYLFSEYERIHPNVTIKVTKFPWHTYWKKINLTMESNEGPDLFHMHNSYTKDMLPYLEQFPSDVIPYDELIKDFPSAPLTLIDDKMYFMNIGKSTGGIFYNKDMWSKQGLTDKDFPKTWDELRKVALKLTKYDEDGNIIVDGFNFNDTDGYILLALMLQRNIPSVSEKTSEPKFESKENIENIQYLRRMETIDKICRSDEGPAWHLFGTGNAAMIYSWSWVGNVLDTNYSDVNYGFFPIPVWDKDETTLYERYNYECTFGVNNQIAKEKQAVCFDIMKFYLCNDEALKKAAEQALIVPSKQSLIDSNELKDNFIITEQMKYIDKTGFMEINSLRVNNLIENSLGENVMNKFLTPQEVLKLTDTEMMKISSNNN